jgi:penicillin-binding protein 2
MSDFVEEKRARIIARFFLVFFSILLIRFFHLQVLSGSVYKVKSERNSVRQIPVAASRGLILDRHNRIIVDNRPSYSLFIIPYQYEKDILGAMVTASVLGMSHREIEERIRESGDGPFSPVRLMRDMNFESLSAVEENRFDLPGVFYQIESVRTYPAQVRASHVLGYLGEISEAEMVTMQADGYRQGEFVGKSGVENKYDAVLRGRRGYRYVEVDVKGREVGNFEGTRDVSPVPGNDLTLTLDLDLQMFAESVLDNRQGSVILLDPRNGEVLTLVSKPDFPLEPFAKVLSPQAWDELISDPQKPLLDRSIQAQLPPGSTYKIVLTLAAISENNAVFNDSVRCDGYYRLGRRIYHCWKEEGHGNVDLLAAFKGSCNVFYYQLGIELGFQRWVRVGKHFHFGELTRIDLPGEAHGLLPDGQYMDSKYGTGRWGKGMMANLAVGQGDLLVTPIQMAKLTAAVAMKGVCYEPHIVRSIRDPSFGQWVNRPVKFDNIEGIPGKSFDWIKMAMSHVVNRTGGTGRGAWVKGVKVCGKTGTAQNPRGEDHAWFVGFAPMENPEVVIAIMVENGGSGGTVAAPMAGKILRRFFQRETVS